MKTTPKKTAPKKTTGRPPRERVAMQTRLEFRCSDAEKRRWMCAAKKSGETLSDWIRARLGK